MKLITQVSRIYKEKGYEKSWIVIPSKILKEIDFKGKELECQKINKNEIRIRIKKEK